jgi:hypothetical protein
MVEGQTPWLGDGKVKKRKSKFLIQAILCFPDLCITVCVMDFITSD